jgi:hypothetical protein
MSETKRKRGRPTKAEKAAEQAAADAKAAEERKKLVAERLAAFGLTEMPKTEEGRVDLLRQLLLDQMVVDLLMAEPGSVSAPAKRAALDLIKATGSVPDLSERHRREAAERAAGGIIDEDSDVEFEASLPQALVGFNDPDGDGVDE